jgi:beta-galactosidase
MHYFRHDPSEWGRGLDAMKAMGLRIVDIYVPWAVHETGRETFDFGKGQAWLDVRKFILECQARDLLVVLRPGPHINAELTYFGIPERVVWTEACQARTPKGNPVMLPMVPLGFPVPSYASDVFHEETARWFEAVGREVADLQYPHGPIVMVQVDNEGALYFRDGPYDQDYHPDAVRHFRSYLREKYQTVHALREAWNDDSGVQFATVEPPARFAAQTPEDLVRHMDWVEFHEELLSSAMARFAKALRDAGFDRVPTMHNMPLGESATPLNPKRMGKSIDLIALDYYHHATPESHAILVRRTTELASRCEGERTPAYAAEMGAGFPPFFPPMTEDDSIYTLLAGLAYGLRGFSLYMAVDRDRWVGAPIDAHGTPRPMADRYRRILQMLERHQFHSLRRRTPVRLVMPRALRRLARAAHAFGPITPAAFNVSGASFSQSCLEDDWGFGESPMTLAEEYLRAFEHALLTQGVPYAYAGGETLEESSQGAKWVIVGLAGGIKPAFFDALRMRRAQGVHITVGPSLPLRDGSMRPLATPPDPTGLELVPLDDRTHIERLVAHRIEELGLGAHSVSPEQIFLSVHEGADGQAKLVFVMNPTAQKVQATWSVEGASVLRDAVDGGAELRRSHGAFSAAVPPHTTRVYEVLEYAPRSLR